MHERPFDDRRSMSSSNANSDRGVRVRREANILIRALHKLAASPSLRKLSTQHSLLVALISKPYVIALL